MSTPMNDALTRYDRRIVALENKIATLKAALSAAQTEAEARRQGEIEALAECRKLRAELNAAKRAVRTATEPLRRDLAKAHRRIASLVESDVSRELAAAQRQIADFVSSVVVVEGDDGPRQKRVVGRWGFSWHCPHFDQAPAWALAERDGVGISVLYRRAVIHWAGARGVVLVAPVSLMSRAYRSPRGQHSLYTTFEMPASWREPLQALGFGSAAMRDAVTEYVASRAGAGGGGA